MAVPEWLDSRGFGAALGPECPAPADGVRGRGAATTFRCRDLAAAGNAIIERCNGFFESVVLAHLDAALAHEFARQDSIRVASATEAVDQAVLEGRSTQALAHLSQQVAAARAAAEKSGAQAALATDVACALGGSVGDEGFDSEVVDELSGAALIDTIDALEKAKNSLAAAQAYAQALFVAQQRLAQSRAGIPKTNVGRGIAHQVALARHESPHRGRQLAEMSEILVREMPCSMNAFMLGKISEYRAGLVVKETAFLSREDRAAVDRQMCGDPDAVALLGSRELSTAARRAAYGLDPQAFVKRHEKAVGDRCVTLRPAADGMTYLTALIPLKQGVRILATLTKVADSGKAAGDERGKGQIMADALMHRLVQHAPCDEGAGTPSDHRGAPVGGFEAADTSLPEAAAPADSASARASGAGNSAHQLCTSVDEASISLELVMTDRALFGSDNEPAVLVGYEPIPAPMARTMVLGGGGGGGGAEHGPAPQVWLKRLFTHPATNQLLAMDSQSRLFPEGMKEFLRIQDQRCREPYCDAPIREYDHIKAYAAGGATSMDNGQGLCSDCNHAKEAPGWSATRAAEASAAWEGPPATKVTTPTGHRYVSSAPPLPGTGGRRRQ